MRYILRKHLSQDFQPTYFVLIPSHNDRAKFHPLIIPYHSLSPEEQQQNQQPEQNEQQMDKETAEQILQALEQDEQETQEKLQRQQGKKRRVEKEW